MNTLVSTQSHQYRWFFALILVLAMLALSACNAQSQGNSSADESVAKPPRGKVVSLTLAGYNYTNRYIDTFSVNGQGGGNLFISGPTSGGGGSICCVSYVNGLKDWTVEVRWQSDACKYDSGMDQGVMKQRTHSYFKEVKVQVDPNIPDRPQYFEVHFYPDGHVEAAVTEHASPPRLILSEDRKDKTPYPRCPGGKQPKE